MSAEEKPDDFIEDVASYVRMRGKDCRIEAPVTIIVCYDPVRGLGIKSVDAANAGAVQLILMMALGRTQSEVPREEPWTPDV